MSNSRVLEQVQMEEEITFSAGTPNPDDVSNRLILAPKCYEQQRIVYFYPAVPFRLELVEFDPDSDDLDIDFVQVSNILCAAFAKRHPVCDVGSRIILMVSYRGDKEIKTTVRLRGTGLVEQREETRS